MCVAAAGAVPDWLLFFFSPFLINNQFPLRYTFDMTQIGSLIVPPELQALFANLFAPVSPRKRGAVRKTGYLLSRQQKLKVSTRSLLPQIRDLWNALSEPQRQAWKDAGAVTSMNGWNLFVQDTAYRLKYDISGVATPSEIHQYKVGRIEIEAPASKVMLAQFHPNKYYVSKKLPGKTTQREDVAIYEYLQLPLTIGCSFRSNLIATTGTPRIKFYAIVYSSYQGRTLETEVGFDIPLTSDWTTGTATISDVVGVARSYDLRIDLDGVRGWFEWDNVKAIHSGTNYARDLRCNDVNNNLTRANYQIEKSWEEQFLPSGTGFDSVYPAD